MLEQIAAKYFNKKSAEPAEILARATGLEPVTYGLTAGPKNSEKFFVNIVCDAEIVGLRIV